MKTRAFVVLVANVQFIQFLHGLQSQRGIYDDRLYAGPLSEFHYDVTQAGVDPAAVGAGSSSAGLEDFIGFHASAPPSAYEIGYYGIEGNGVDDHALGKPSEGVHLSVENNWQSAPYGPRMGTDEFPPAQRWVAGAQRWNLGNLAAGQSTSLDVLLTLRTGTRVLAGTSSSGGCNGDTLGHTLSVTTRNLTTFALGVDAATPFTVVASVAPAMAP